MATGHVGAGQAQPISLDTPRAEGSVLDDGRCHLTQPQPCSGVDGAGGCTAIEARKVVQSSIYRRSHAVATPATSGPLTGHHGLEYAKMEYMLPGANSGPIGSPYACRAGPIPRRRARERSAWPMPAVRSMESRPPDGPASMPTNSSARCGSVHAAAAPPPSPGEPHPSEKGPMPVQCTGCATNPTATGGWPGHHGRTLPPAPP